MKKYLIIPGTVISMNDGQRHFISAQKLMELYGVPEDECIVVKKGGQQVFPDLNLINLMPRYDGKYKKINPPS